MAIFRPKVQCFGQKWPITKKSIRYTVVFGEGGYLGMQTSKMVFFKVGDSLENVIGASADL